MQNSLRSVAKFLCILLVSLASQAVMAKDTPSVVETLLEKRQDKVILQQWELSCGAAALATVLRYQHHLPVTERSVALGLINRPEYLKNPDLVRYRQGFSLLDMKRFTDQLGLTGVGLGQLAFEDILQRAPIIVPINTRGYPHFVVFRGATDSHVLIADPAFGNITLSKDIFLHSWIKYKNFGFTGFIVTRNGKVSKPGDLKAMATDFYINN